MKDVYNANDTSSSDVEDSHYEKDKGGYDVVTRATSKSRTYIRGSYPSEMASHLKQKLLMVP